MNLIRIKSAIILTATLLAGCAGTIERASDDIPPHIARIPDAVPKVEPLAKSGNAPSYTVNGQRYFVKSQCQGYVERGLASWYGKPFHGRKTSSGETYDMHAMSAAHKTLPLPTYARITNLTNGRSIVIRINDRGPFHEERLIDLSHTAAVKLGVTKTGTARVEVRALEPEAVEEPSIFFAALSKTKAIAQALLP
jgi:rare lipoprotein A